MDTFGLIAVLIGVYLLDSAVKNRRPLELARQIIEKPGSIREAVSGASGFVATSASGSPSQQSAFTPDTASTQKAIAWAVAQVGKPYVWGGTGDNNAAGGFDCSGLVSTAYKKGAGIVIPRTTSTMMTSTKLRSITKDELQPGDLVFPFVGHVQMYIGNGQIVEAPGRGRNVQIKTLGKVWQARRVKAVETSGTSGGGGQGGGGKSW